MNKIVFDEIHKEVLREIEPILIQKFRAYTKDLLEKPYPEQIPISQIIEIILEFNLYAATATISEAVRAATLTVQKHYEKR